MTFTEILTNEGTSDSQKVSELVETVSVIRKKYGNENIELEVPYVTTTDGNVKLNYLPVADKLAVAEREIRRIIIDAQEAENAVEGLVVDRKVEASVSTNPFLCNLSATSGSSYL